MRRLIAAMLLAGVVAAEAKEGLPEGQLPKTARPLHYALHLTVDPAREEFSGEVEIKVSLSQASDQLWLHGRDLTVSAVSVQPAQGEAFAAQYQQVTKEGVAKISFGRKLTAQTLQLRLSYTASYNKSLEGLYKVTRDGTPYIVTQMEPVSARYAFPGFDEPAFKTPYDLRLTLPEQYAGLANTRQIAETRDAGMKTLSFATTAPLPTYLIAFAVGPWDVVSAADIPASALRATPVPLRAIAPRGQGVKLKYALDHTAEIFLALEEYFGRPYPFDKLDIAAVPDFSAGAMENAGLITYRDSLLLLDEHSPVNLLQSYYLVHAHEMAHQWFGNLVTMPWWDDLWLNEAFATWMARKIVLQLKPEHRSDLEGVAKALAAAKEDSLSTARRIRNPIRNNGDIAQAFDGITYSKGGAVLSMFEAWMGADQFRDGIRAYLQKHAGGSATSEDLISALAIASGRGAVARRAFRSFLTQPGIPLIDANISCAPGKVELDLRQSRYLPYGSKATAKQSWGVPVCLRLGFGDKTRRECVLLDTPRSRFLLDTPQCPSWVLPNADAAGYYRFQLKPAALKQLSAQTGKLTPAEQVIFADAVASGFDRGEVSAAQLLESMPALASSPVPAVARALLPALDWMQKYLADDTSRRALRLYADTVYATPMKALGAQRRAGEAEDNTLLRQALYTALALDLRVPAARGALLAEAQAMLANSSESQLKLDTLDQDLLHPILAVLVQEQGAPVLERYFDALMRDGEAGQRIALLKATGAVSDPALAERVREFGLSDAVKIGESERYYFSAHFAQPENRAASWFWFQKNIGRYQARIPVWQQSYLPDSVSETWCDAEGTAELEAFFTPRLKDVAGMERILKSAVERIRLCAALRQKQGTGLAAWAAKN